MRIQAPTYTQTPNDLIDHWLPYLKEVELKVLLVIIRKTFGWHKERDKISLSQLETLTGSTASSIISAINDLIKKGLIEKEVVGPNGKQQTFYQLVVHCNSNIPYPSEINSGEDDSNNSYPSRKKRGVPLGETPLNLGVTKETDTKENSVQTEDQTAHKKTDSETASSAVTAAVFSESVPSVKSPKKSKEDHVKDSLKDLGGDESFIKWALRKFGVDKLLAAGEYYNARIEKTPIDNPIGYIRTALVEGYV